MTPIEPLVFTVPEYAALPDRKPNMRVLVRIAIAQLRREREARMAKMLDVEDGRGKAA